MRSWKESKLANRNITVFGAICGLGEKGLVGLEISVLSVIGGNGRARSSWHGLSTQHWSHPRLRSAVVKLFECNPCVSTPSRTIASLFGLQPQINVIIFSKLQ